MGCDGYIKVGHHPTFRCYVCGKLVEKGKHEVHATCTRDRNGGEMIPVDVEDYE